MSLRYVILRHSGVAEPHYDLMFEPGPDQPLKTFRAPAWPITARTPLTPLPDHRRHYLDYEGPVSGNRGRVDRIDAGVYTIDPDWDWQTHPLRLTLHPAGIAFILRPADPLEIEPDTSRAESG